MADALIRDENLRYAPPGFTNLHIRQQQIVTDKIQSGTTAEQFEKRPAFRIQISRQNG